MALTLSDFYTADRLEQLFSGQTNWTTVLASNMASLNYILPFIKGVVESLTTAAPATPDPGTSPVFFLPADPTGDFAGHGREFALYDPASETWKFFTPYEGYTFFCKADKKRYVMLAVDNYFVPTEI